MRVRFASKGRLQYNQHGAAGLRVCHQGSKGHPEEKEKGQVLARLAQQFPHVGRQPLKRYPESEYGLRYKSTSSYQELLHQAGISYKKRQALNPGKDAQKRLEKREQVQQENWVVVLAEECHLLWGEVCGYGWIRTY